MVALMTSRDNSQPHKVIAIVVTFNPVTTNLSSLVSQLETQSYRTIIVDNGSDNIEDISRLQTSCSNVELLSLSDNIGIAAAQNKGIRHGLTLGGDFTLFFDQDSSIAEDFVSKMVEDFVSLKQSYNIAALGPTLQDSRYKKIYPVIRMSRHGLRTKIIPDITSSKPVEVSCVIASGCLVDNKVLLLDNLMDDSLFIDYVDTEWCLRVISRGFKIFITPNVIMQHEIGDAHIEMLGFVIPVHSAWRRYYRVRNGVFMLKMPHIPKLLAIREIVFSFVHQMILLYKSKNIEYLKVYFRAMSDAVRKLL
ncbi:glycosyltransferase family 2 protein [Enterobacter sp. TCD1-1]|uniref:glycosyltransferase family 2 protein n=1 Tax=Enterobacter sp. TCD1-1 TaxID=1955625 RepID=UPI001E575458|nr:glycosyltransferase family 2 protein [Enterobacter sp. TCD1-1]MCB5948173.1 glycosyltransferase family 2 protein [Enterobacter sp. TCD1-1]